MLKCNVLNYDMYLYFGNDDDWRESMEGKWLKK